MSRKANCYDNAAMEAFWSRLKREALEQERPLAEGPGAPGNFRIHRSQLQPEGAPQLLGISITCGL